jgi:hypothetical protein
MTEKNFVFIGTPCFGGLVNQGYMQSIIALMQYAGTEGFDLGLGVLGHDSLITRSRNTLVSSFLNETRATHLLFIDADISFQPEQVGRMLAADKDVVAGVYPLKILDWNNLGRLHDRPNESLSEKLLHYVGEPLPGGAVMRDGAFVTATYAGTGFMMIRRAVIERMIEAYPELAYDQIHAFPVPKVTPKQYALFECLIEAGTYLSEDFAFCHRWRALGGDVWLDTEGCLTHTGNHDFHGNPAARLAVPA